MDVSRQSMCCAKHIWKYGRVEASVYDPERGVVQYAIKEARGDDWWFFTAGRESQVGVRAGQEVETDVAGLDEGPHGQTDFKEEGVLGQPERLLRVEDMVPILSVDKSWIYGHAYELGVFKMGKYWRFYWPRVLAHLERNFTQGDSHSEA